MIWTIFGGEVTSKLKRILLKTVLLLLLYCFKFVCFFPWYTVSRLSTMLFIQLTNSMNVFYRCEWTESIDVNGLIEMHDSCSMKLTLTTDLNNFHQYFSVKQKFLELRHQFFTKKRKKWKKSHFLTTWFDHSNASIRHQTQLFWTAETSAFIWN